MTADGKRIAGGTVIGRRALLSGAAAMVTVPPHALPIPAGNRLGFDVVRGRSKLGTHVLTFEPGEGSLTVHIAVALAYRILGVTLYRYIHHATETWRDGEVVGIETETDDDGTRYRVSGHRESGELVVEGTRAPRYVAPANALPATHWNRRELVGPWINTQDGRLMRPTVTRSGIEAIPAANGTTLHARLFALTGDVHLDIFYNDRLGWAGLSFVKDGVPIRYERQI